MILYFSILLISFHILSNGIVVVNIAQSSLSSLSAQMSVQSIMLAQHTALVFSFIAFVSFHLCKYEVLTQNNPYTAVSEAEISIIRAKFEAMSGYDAALKSVPLSSFRTQVPHDEVAEHVCSFSRPCFHCRSSLSLLVLTHIIIIFFSLDHSLLNEVDN
jgi:hypothetical protein